MANDIDQIMNSVADIAAETYRLRKVFQRAIRNADPREQKKYLSQFGWFEKKVNQSLEELGLHVVSVEGQPYDPGMAVTPLNLEDFGQEEDLIVAQMMEPVILQGDRLVRMGTVMLERAEPVLPSDETAAEETVREE